MGLLEGDEDDALQRRIKWKPDYWGNLEGLKGLGVIFDKHTFQGQMSYGSVTYVLRTYKVKPAGQLWTTTLVLAVWLADVLPVSTKSFQPGMWAKLASSGAS